MNEWKDDKGLSNQNLKNFYQRNVVIWSKEVKSERKKSELKLNYREFYN